ncbi:metalloregulator ArsR/SmtB family transcription factor [uncultured Roseobacter sp.]|uniref:ArsR/SmtB family transcription factor n=1 Tax=uncultured Roseobacter sp. TaxID=114847 RepID=UPI00262CBE79|nr:metalloregulator ArsR/SmtB family transcription factor [uncultured Roseobacter sp.]
MNEEDAIAMLGALSQEMRLRIIRYLIGCGEGGAAAGEIAEAMDAISSKASFHLSALERAGLITSERQSRKIIYRVSFLGLGGLLSFILNDCCSNHPDIREHCGLPNFEC